jgi:hypothetical protein
MVEMKDINDRIQVLKQRHKSLCDELTMAMESRQPDSAVTDIKKAKLRLKDEINQLENQVDTDVKA